MADEDLPISELKAIAFPDCAKKCALVKYLGVGECDSACGHKFKKVDKQPYEYITLSQDQLNESLKEPRGV
jgi:hypothetical protein